MPNAVVEYLSATIANGQTVSGVVDLKKRSPVGLLLPSALTGTAITFQMSDTLDGTYVAIHSGGAALSVTVGTSRYVVLDPANFRGVRFLKLVSGSAEGAARTILVATRELD